MQVLAPRKISIITIAAVGLAALMLLLTARSAAAEHTITSVSPNVGPTAGGTVITITGTGFEQDAEVTVDGEPATEIDVNDAGTQITATTPEGESGPAAIVVSSDEHDVTVLNEFSYLGAPLVIGLSPDTAAAGTSIAIFGTGFVDGATVLFGATAGTEVDVVSENEITVVVPAGTGTVDVTVTNEDDQSDILEDAFMYAADEDTTGEIISGDIPATGFGLFVFGGGTNAQLLEASECPQATATFYATNSSGGFVAYIPGSGVAAVNAAWNALFPSGIPELEPLIGKCA